MRRNYWGGDCYAHGLLALGQIDVIAETTMKLWDWAALVPVVEGAGGRVTDWAGQPLRPGGDGRVLSVGDPALLDAGDRAAGGVVRVVGWGLWRCCCYCERRGYDGAQAGWGLRRRCAPRNDRSGQ